MEEMRGSGRVRIPGYSDARVIGRGASSIVYRATDDQLDRSVAIKVLLADDPEDPARKRFRREGVITANLGKHPHIVQVLETGFTEDGQPFVAMELYEQGSVADRIQASGTFNVADALDVGIKVADAVAAAHRSGILHRDIKPQNVLLSEYGAALGDFGIARATANLEWSQSLDQLTPLHAAPEILMGGTSTAQSDIYSIGSTLFTMLAGRPPFAGPPGEAPLRYQVRVMQEPVPLIPRADVPPDVRLIIERCLAKVPSERYKSAAELRDAMEEQLHALRSHGQRSNPEAAAHETSPFRDGGRAATGNSFDEQPTTNRGSTDSLVDGAPSAGLGTREIDDAPTEWPASGVSNFLGVRTENPEATPVVTASRSATHSSSLARRDDGVSVVEPSVDQHAIPLPPWAAESPDGDDGGLTVHRPIVASPTEEALPSPAPPRGRRVALITATALVVVGALVAALVLRGGHAPQELNKTKTVTTTDTDRPTNIALTPSSQGATLQWTGTADAPLNYLVFEVTPKGSKLVGRTTHGNTRMTIRGVNATATTDCFEIAAVLGASKLGEPGRWCPANESVSGG